MKYIQGRKRTVVHWLPVYGCIATGIIYAGIGVVALLSFFRLRNGGADEGSLLVILNDYIIGKVFIGFILLGTVCYIVWRFYEAITDPYGYDNGVKGVVKRIGIALSTVADVFIVYSAIRILLGASHIQPDGQPVEERGMTQQLLKSNGSWPVIGLGIVYIITAVVQLVYGITQGYRERVDIERFSSLFRHVVHVLAWAGYAARGIILGIIGFFFLKAGFLDNARYVVNTDKAFDFIGDDVGHVWFIFVAVATFCYGVFMFAQGVAYDSDRD